MQKLKDHSTQLTPGHFEQARVVVRPWRQGGYDYVVVVRRRARAERCYPCRRQDVPQGAVAGWDYYPIPSLHRLGASDDPERSASRAEIWVAATIAGGCQYGITQL